LTFYRCDKTGDLPILNWEQHEPTPPKEARSALTNAERQSRFRQRRRNENRNGEFTPVDTEVHSHGRKCYVSSRQWTQKPNNPIDRNDASSPHWTHIDVYQEVEERGGKRFNCETAALAGPAPPPTPPRSLNPVDDTTLPDADPWPDLPACLDRRNGRT
jgi:hypothetical protein